MTRLIREPLVHFVLLSIAIFGLYQLVSANRHSADRTIVITSADINRLASLYAVETGAMPTEQEMRGIMLDYVEQEALAREARRLGMAEDDTVVQRRLAQKMTFMLSDVSAIDTPSDDVLQSWLEANVERFELPVRVSFDHVFFSDANDPRMVSTLSALRSQAEAEWQGLGDPFMLQRRYTSLPERELVRLFGPSFADAVIASDAEEDGSWRGPVPSAFGAHLVRITARIPARMPALEEIKPDVLQDWRDHQQRARTSDKVAEIVDRYVIVVEGESER